jgi:hypothetical protein
MAHILTQGLVMPLLLVTTANYAAQPLASDHNVKIEHFILTATAAAGTHASFVTLLHCYIYAHVFGGVQLRK